MATTEWQPSFLQDFFRTADVFQEGRRGRCGAKEKGKRKEHTPHEPPAARRQGLALSPRVLLHVQMHENLPFCPDRDLGACQSCVRHEHRILHLSLEGRKPRSRSPSAANLRSRCFPAHDRRFSWRSRALPSTVTRDSGLSYDPTSGPLLPPLFTP